MIPSRGLRWSSQTIGIGRRRFEPISTRKFSSLPVQHGFKASTLLSSRSALPRAMPPSRTSTLIRTGASIRFASTSPISTTSTTPPSQAIEQTSSALEAQSSLSSAGYTTSLDSATDFTSQSLHSIPEHIGYLKSLGLDFGYGPTSGMEWLLEHVHILAGTPWWLSISLTAILIRLVLFKPFVNAAENAARMQTIKPFTKPITDKMMAASRAGNSDLTMQLRGELQAINKRAGISYLRGFMPMVQVFTGYGMFVLLRAMSDIPVPGLETGGFLWLYNLSIPDPYFVLPLATAGVLHWVLRRGGETAVTTLTPQMAALMTWGFPALTIIFTWWLPAALQLSFFVSGLMSFMQSTLFRQTWFRSYMNMTPIPPPIKPDAPTPSPYKGTMKVSANPVLSQSELNSRFQGAGKEQSKPGMLSGVKDTFKGLKDKANDKADENKSKAQAKEAARYEKKRQEEVRLDRMRREQDKRVEREMKKKKVVKR